MKTVSISSGIYIFPVTLLALFQFFAIVLSSLTVPFALSILFALAMATTLSYTISRAFATPIHSTKRNLFVAVAISVVMTFLVVLRLNFTIADFICPTGTLGLTTQIAEGIFPVSYQSFPEFHMNYHQGFLFITGLMTAGLSIPVAAAHKVTFALLYFFINLGVMLFFIQRKNTYFYLPPLLFLFVASASPAIYNALQAVSQPKISVLEFSTGNSWPLALLLLTALLFVIKKYQHSKQHIVYVALLVLTLSTINAVVFQMLLLGLGCFYVGNLLVSYYKERKFDTKNILLIYTVALIVFFAPKIIPSAFMVGSMYGAPEVALRFLSPDQGNYWQDLKSYLLLMNILPIGTFVLALASLRRLPQTQIFLTLLLGVSLILPAVFRFTNVIDWDMTYKFSFFSLFISAILVTLLLEQTKQYQKIIFACIFVSILISSQTTYELFTKKMSLDFTSSNEPPAEMSDIVTFLSKHKTLLIPYRHGEPPAPHRAISTVYCDSSEDYNEIAQYSGNFIRDSYKTNFLLNETFEGAYQKNASWNDFGGKATDVATELEGGATLIVSKRRLDPASQKNLERILNAEKTEFEHYILYRTEPW